MVNIERVLEVCKDARIFDAISIKGKEYRNCFIGSFDPICNILYFFHDSSIFPAVWGEGTSSLLRDIDYIVWTEGKTYREGK